MQAACIPSVAPALDLSAVWEIRLWVSKREIKYNCKKTAVYTNVNGDM